MKFIALLSLFVASNAFAQKQNFFCKVTYNLETVLETNVSIDNQEVTFGTFEAFSFHLKQKANNKIELQIANMDEPARSYASAELTKNNDNVQLSIWTKLYIIEANCALIN